MIYKRAFFVAFVVIIIGLGLYWYSSNQIASESSLGKWPSFQWFEYQTWGLIIFCLGVVLFGVFIGVAVKNWIHW